MKSLLIRDILLLATLIIIILLVNSPVITFDMVYFEQATIYSANQMIHSLSDLLDVYLHPKMLQFAIPFFRPSGHFLLYQLIAPVLGWQNTKALFIINFVFLALAGLCIIKLYQALFPRYKAGAYVALAIYVMHPLLNQSRLTVMHFEFVYIFFCMLSLYLFVRFCQRNINKEMVVSQMRFRAMHLFAASLFFYIVAVSFKEPSIMLGPVFLCYLCLQFYNDGPRFKYIAALCANAQIRELAILVTVCAVTLVVYFTLPWAESAVSHPLRPVNAGNVLGAANIFLRQLFALGFDPIPFGDLPSPKMTWRHIQFPAMTRYLLWGMLVVMTASLFLLNRNDEAKAYNKSLLFLFISGLLFLLLPLLWGMGLPWHLSLTLVCLSLMMGFSLEYLLRRLFKREVIATSLCLLFAAFSFLMTVSVNHANINAFKTEDPDFYFALRLNRNALSAPPDIKSRLNAASVIVVENSLIKDDYSIGNSIYPYFISMDRRGFAYAIKNQQVFFSRFDPTYNGSLFRWAYQMPALKEEVYPFKISQIYWVPNEIIYNWLSNYDNIFCLGYDEEANWHDRTSSFKAALLQEKTQRHMTVREFEIKPGAAFEGNLFNVLMLPYPDPQLCQYSCDQNALCKGFNYIYTQFNNHTIIQCKFYDLITATSKFCSACTGYIKPELS